MCIFVSSLSHIARYVPSFTNKNTHNKVQINLSELLELRVGGISKQVEKLTG